MSRAPIADRTTGEVWCNQRADGKWVARTRVRVHGKLQGLQRTGTTRRQAETLLKAAVRDALASQPKVKALSLEAAALEWLEEIERDTRYASRTKEVYAGMVRKHLSVDTSVPTLTTRDCEKLLATIAQGSGPGAAKTARSVLSKVLARAVRHGLLERNVLRDAEPVRLAPSGKRPVRDIQRALTKDEERRLVERAESLERVHVTRDLADLCRFMLCSATRIGEALAVRWEDVDLQRQEVHINGKVCRLLGTGLVRERPKTLLSVRTLPLSSEGLRFLTARYHGQAPATPVFGAVRDARTWRDPSNTNADLRQLFDDVGLKWATPHVFRRTQLTRLAEAGVSPGVLANFAGHSDPSMTLRKYVARRGANDDQLKKALN